MVDAVMKADAATKAQDLTWEEDKRVACTHTQNLVQAKDAPILASKALSNCQSCDINENLWLCLTCGALGCSREVYGGTGGRGHAKKHFETHKHPLVCKMGTITPEGTADIYCYACDEMRLDELLGAHMAHFGIDIGTQKVTSKTISEMQLDLNLKANFNAILDQDGKEEDLCFGGGFTGLENLGNSCYMASVVQVLFSLPQFQRRYLAEGKQHLATCTNNRPAECFFLSIK